MKIWKIEFVPNVSWSLQTCVIGQVNVFSSLEKMGRNRSLIWELVYASLQVFLCLVLILCLFFYFYTKFISFMLPVNFIDSTKTFTIFTFSVALSDWKFIYRRLGFLRICSKIFCLVGEMYHYSRAQDKRILKTKGKKDIFPDQKSAELVDVIWLRKYLIQTYSR